MGEEVSGSKGFFITVAVLLALAMVVSYFGDSTGQAVRGSRIKYTVTSVPAGDTGSDESSSTAQQRINPIDPGRISPPECRTPWIDTCGYQVSGSAQNVIRARAETAATTACEANKKKEEESFKKCMEHLERRKCDTTKCKRTTADVGSITPCTVIACSSVPDAGPNTVGCTATDGSRVVTHECKQLA